MEYLLEMTNKSYNYDVAIIDYGLGNLQSIKNICDEVGILSIITNDKITIQKSKSIILPGVGSFPAAMKNLTDLKLIEEIIRHSNSGKIIWGICLGFQLLFDTSNEFVSTKGLSLLRGNVVNIDCDYEVSKPHIGWNICRTHTEDSFIKLMRNNFYYFNHSFAVVNSSYSVISETTYDKVTFISAIHNQNIIGTQFHPEKSGENGVLLFRRFKNLLGA